MPCESKKHNPEQEQTMFFCAFGYFLKDTERRSLRGIR